MYDRRTRNVEIFGDTKYRYQNNKKLASNINDSIKEQKLILEGDVVNTEPKDNGAGKVIVSPKRTLEASESYAKQGKNVCILNFASATNPGGGVTRGSSAQEEAICRCSTLYPCLDYRNMWENFYIPHRNAQNPLYNNDCIFTPNGTVFKSDTNFPELLPETKWWNVNVITCAAPNLRNVPSNRMNPFAGTKKANISQEELRELLRKRIERVFEVAMANEAEVLILGAWGCGAFRNPPKLVAEIFGEFTEKYRNCFDTIEYAVFHTEYEKTNYEAFKQEMKRFL